MFFYWLPTGVKLSRTRVGVLIFVCHSIGRVINEVKLSVTCWAPDAWATGTRRGRSVFCALT